MQETIGTSKGEAVEEFILKGGTYRNKHRHFCPHYREGGSQEKEVKSSKAVRVRERYDREGPPWGEAKTVQTEKDEMNTSPARWPVCESYALPFAGCVILVRSLNLSGTQFPHLQNQDSARTYDMGLL